MQRCLECGFDYASAPPAEAPALLRDGAPAFRAAVEDVPEEVLRTKPGPWTWSALEYLCHVRDVYEVYRARVALVQVEDEPPLPPMQRDERALTERYNEDDPAAVLCDLEANAEALAATLEALPAPGWSRGGVQQVGRRDVVWMAANTVHEATHHLADVRRVLEAVRSDGP